MKIVQVSPLYEGSPRQLYGGTERVVSYLTEEPVRQGHQVILFASGDSQSEAIWRPGCDTALRLDPRYKDPLPHYLIMLNRVARSAGMPIKIAAKVDKADLDYYSDKIMPLLKGLGIEFIGEIGEREKRQFPGGAVALLFPIDWPEPFGLVMIEAMANGTPVIAFRRGSVPEIIDEGVTGFIVDNTDAAIAALPRVAGLDRLAVRRRFEERFSAERMARDYVERYSDVLSRSSVNAVVLSTRAADRRDAA